MNVRSISMYIYTYIDMFGKYIAVKGQSTLWIDISFKKRRISYLSMQHPFFNALARRKLRLLMLKLMTTLSP